MLPRRGRAAVSKLAVALAIIVILAVAGVYAFFPRGSTTPASSSSVSSPSISVSTAVNKMLQNFNDRNVDGMASFYTPSSIDVWSGDLGGLQGKYTGASDIKLLYATTVGKSTSLDANISNYAEERFSPTSINTTFVISMLANSTVAGIVSATIDVRQAWNWGSAGWQISKENWAYTHFYSSYISAGIPSEATTFPQWRVMEAGGNPNLVSEKSFEWHVGPYLAASVYAFLFGIVFVFVVRMIPSGGSLRGSEGHAQ